MSLKPFCDLCDAPALAMHSVWCENYKRKAAGKVSRFSLEVSFHKNQSDGHSRTTDEFGHICCDCLVNGLRDLADEFDRPLTNKEKRIRFSNE